MVICDSALFFLTGKIKIQDILACSFLDDLLEVGHFSYWFFKFPFFLQQNKFVFVLFVLKQSVFNHFPPLDVFAVER